MATARAPRGVKSDLGDDDRRKIVDLHDRGASQRQIADLFNVSQPTISRALADARNAGAGSPEAIHGDSDSDLAAWARAQPSVLRTWIAAEAAYRKALAEQGDIWPLRERHGLVIKALAAEQTRRRAARDGLPVIG